MKKTHKMKRIQIPRFFVMLLFLICSVQQTFSQQLTVVGTVVDEKNEPIIGATVKLIGTSKGTITDLNGKFSLSASKNSTVEISYVGMKSQTIKMDGKPLFITLEANTQSLDEVVVVGYGISTKRDVTGSMSKVNISDVMKAPVPNVTDALGGRIAGVTVTTGDGQPGAGAAIVIRGSNSLTGDNSPLYVVDGFPLENANLNSTPPEDIESIEILKDASATAIYGARGANGVILITTKKGKVGKPVISYDGSYGFQQVAKHMNVMNAYEYVKMTNEFNPTIAASRYFTNGKTLESYIGYPSMDFQDYMFQTAPMQSHNLAMRGGTENTKYSVSLNAMDQQGVIIYGGYNRLQGRVVLDQKINKSITTGISIGYSQVKSYGVVPAQTNWSTAVNVMTDVWGARPLTPSGSLDEILNSDFDPYASETDRILSINPVINAKNAINERLNKNLNANGYVELKFTPQLKLRISGGINQSENKNSDFYNSHTKNGSPYSTNGVNGQIIYLQNDTWLNENILTYNAKLNKSHKLNVVGGFTMQGANIASFGAASKQCPYESLGLSGLDLGTPLTVSSSSSAWTLASFLGRINYDYKSKYLLTASFRADGSSKFSTENKWSYFPSGSLAWRASEEKFIKNNISAISDLKLRASWGVTGNNRVGDFAAMAQMNGTYYFNGVDYSAIVPTALANSTLRWENTAQTNIGLDLGLLEQRIVLTVDAYRKTTYDLLLNSQMPGSTGYTQSMKNIGKVQNQGLEFTINTINIKTKDFQWSTNFNISFNSNEVLDLAEGQFSMLTPAINNTNSIFYNTNYLAIKGQPIAQLIGYVYDGLYQYSDFNVTPSGSYTLRNDVPCNSPSRTNIVQPGHIKFKDLNGDGIINSNDMTIIGRSLPIHTGGLSNTFNYKNFDLNVFFQWSYGNDIYNGNRYYFESSKMVNQNANKFATYADRWTPENLDATIPVVRGDAEGLGNYASSRCVEDGSYLKLKTVSLGYSLPAKMLKKVGISKLRIFASGQNLYTWTNYSGFDPEVSTAQNQVLSPGFDYSAYPRARTITFGVNASF
jgi:TonB-linked SusC/RagA family outer membrane protein